MQDFWKPDQSKVGTIFRPNKRALAEENTLSTLIFTYDLSHPPSLEANDIGKPVHPHQASMNISWPYQPGKTSDLFRTYPQSQ